ncbi:MAG TPA: hypothetical protein VNN72_05125 [Polyangiaceae bacterium]|nr:hypothetical protein [Polyangiaceae bacterium]
MSHHFRERSVASSRKEQAKPGTSDGTIDALPRCMGHPPVEPTDHDAALVAGRVVESMLELARAEAKLVSAHARTFLARTVGAFWVAWRGLRGDVVTVRADT